MKLSRCCYRGGMGERFASLRVVGVAVESVLSSPGCLCAWLDVDVLGAPYCAGGVFCERGAMVPDCAASMVSDLRGLLVRDGFSIPEADYLAARGLIEGEIAKHSPRSG